MHSLLSLIPFDQSFCLTSRFEKINLLRVCVSILNESNKALLNFKNFALENFDPQVGDTSCQARAFNIAWLRKKFNHSAVTRNKVENEFKYIAIIKNSIEGERKRFCELHLSTDRYIKELDCREGILSFLDSLVVTVSADTLLLITSHFLSICTLKNNLGYLSEVSYEEFASLFFITKTLSKRFIRHYQKMLSLLTCDLFSEIASKIWDDTPHKELIRGLMRVGDNKISCFPCFLGMKLLLLENVERMIPINMKVVRYVSDFKKPHDEVMLVWRPSKETKSYVASEINSKVQSNDYSVLIDGYCIYRNETELENIDSYKKSIINTGLYNIVLANVAAHPQFSGTSLNAFKADPYSNLSFQLTDEQSKIIASFRQELFSFRSKASLIGCTKDNPVLFFLGHVKIRSEIE